jgi:hypothetical protein
MGTVYEPYLGLTPHEDIFTKRLLDGNYFAEAAYASIPGLSWMVTVIGDPLYRPFRVPLESALAAAGTTHTEHDDWLLIQSIRREIVARQIESTAEALQAGIEVPGAGPVAEEGLGGLMEKLNTPQANYLVEQSYKKAMAEYTLPIDQIRVGLKLAQYYVNRREDSRAQAQVEMLQQLFPGDVVHYGLTQKLVPTGSPPLPVSDSPPSPPPPSQKVISNSTELPTPPKPPLPPFPQPVTDEK